MGSDGMESISEQPSIFPPWQWHAFPEQFEAFPHGGLTGLISADVTSEKVSTTKRHFSGPDHRKYNATPSIATHVTIVVDQSFYATRILQGLTRYNRERGNWSICVVTNGLNDHFLEGLQQDGVILCSPALERLQSRRAGSSVVQIGCPASGRAAWPLICSDVNQIASLAAEHFAERGLQHFAFCGNSTGDSLPELAGCFSHIVERDQHHCDLFRPLVAGNRHLEKQRHHLTEWLVRLPKPIGILTSNDASGLEILDACRRCGIRVPTEVAVMGVGNDEQLCNLGVPPLTSIDLNAEEIGYAAARLLDSLMHGHQHVTTQTIQPRGVVTRRSTHMIASEDREIGQAIRFIGEHMADRLRVQDIVSHVGVSRAALQSRMKEVTGRTIREEIERARIARVKELLLTSDMEIKQIARATGFCNVQYMTRLFAVTIGKTPARFRSPSRNAHRQVRTEHRKPGLKHQCFASL